MLDVGVGDEMMRCPCSPCPFVILSLSPCPPLPGSSVPACFGLFPRPPGRVMCGRMSICGCWRRVGLLACHHVHTAHSAYRSFAFPVGLRSWVSPGCASPASLLAGFRHRLCCRVVSYSIPDEMMRITGSCGIRLACLSCLLAAVVSVLRAMRAGFLRARPVPRPVPRTVPRTVGRFASRPCLLDVRRRVSRRSLRHLIALAWLRAVSLCVPRIVPLPALFRHRCRCRCRHGFSPPAPSHRHDGRGDTMRPWRLSRLCLLCPIGSVRHLISAVRHRMATGIKPAVHRGHHRCRLLPAHPPNPISLPSCHPAAPSPRFAFPPRSIDTGTGRWSLVLGCLLACHHGHAAISHLRPVRYCGSDFACGLFVWVLCIAAAGIVLLAWLSYYVCCRWGMW